MTQRLWEDVREGEELPELRFPLTVYRLIMAASANRDFNAIHHNSEVAIRTGAPEIYANILLLQGMWERAVRDYIGLAGRIHSLSNFRMNIFNTVGDTVTVKGAVSRKWREGDLGLVAIELRSENRLGISVGPGTIVASLPIADTPGRQPGEPVAS